MNDSSQPPEPGPPPPSSQPLSTELLARASQGDSQAGRALLEQLLPALHAYLRLRAGAGLRARESCSDLAQSVCREALENLDGLEFRGEARFRGWLFQIALRKLVQRKRYWQAERRDARRDLELDSPAEVAACYRTLLTPSRHARGREELTQLELSFDQLSEDHRQVILLSRIGGISHAEVARQMSKSEGATRVLLYRALARLGVLLDKPGQEPPTHSAPADTE